MIRSNIDIAQVLGVIGKNFLDFFHFRTIRTKNYFSGPKLNFPRIWATSVWLVPILNLVCRSSIPR